MIKRRRNHTLRHQVACAAGVLLAMGCLAIPTIAQQASSSPTGPLLVRWPYRQPVALPGPVDATLADFVLMPETFDGASESLVDLRLYAGREEIPYALRVREPKDERQAIQAKIYNRALGPDQSSEAWLDLGTETVEHNEVRIQLAGNDFRRRAVLEGSTDAEHWRQLQERSLIRFRSGQGQIEDLTITYPASRFRYLRARVYRDPVTEKEPVEVQGVSVFRTVKIPGELLTLPAKLGVREPTRWQGSPASSWILDLGGRNIPCAALEVEIGDTSFARDYTIEAGGPAGSQEPFRAVYSDVWQRKAGDKVAPLVARFPEIRAARLRLVVVDHENPPLDLRGGRFTAAARQIVFAAPHEHRDELRLYFGNPEAQAPYYDFARNLAEKLSPQPARGSLGPREANPDYVPKPLPLTERWPWLIYLVLGSVSLVLAAMIASVARQAIALHDAAESEAKEPSAPDSGPARAGG